ncbi:MULTISPECIES: hypothetical protein [Streptomyces]|uniref:hypothetical protein n=1 Tax=Streptomyces TaxID=1883 RepID=UPI00168327DC|nr:hypothetical protein [Streptomyces venezuelae]
MLLRRSGRRTTTTDGLLIEGEARAQAQIDRVSCNARAVHNPLPTASDAYHRRKLAERGGLRPSLPVTRRSPAVAFVGGRPVWPMSPLTDLTDEEERAAFTQYVTDRVPPGVTLGTPDTTDYRLERPADR